MKNRIEKFFSSKWLPLICLFAVAFLIFLPSLFFGFSYLDDNNLILDKGFFIGKFSNFFVFFQTDIFNTPNNAGFYYRPVFALNLMLDYQFFGAAPFMFHFTSLIIHSLMTVLVFILFKKLNYAKEKSFLAAIVFAVHPVLSQAVAWIPGRNDSLMAIFVLISVIYFLDFWRTKEKKYFFSHLIFFTLAIFTKETALFVLPVLAFYAWLSDKREVITLKNLKKSCAWVAILVIWFSLRHLALINSPGLSAEEMFRSVFLNSPAVVQMIGKIIFPFNLSVLPIIEDTVFYYGFATIILLIILTFVTKRKRWGRIIFGLSWFLIFLLPSFIRPNSSLAADFIEHRLYLSLVGFLIFLLEIVPLKKIKIEKKRYWLSALGIILLFGSITIFHSQVFSNRLSFWKNAVENSPHYPLARRNLGAMYYLEGDLEKAEKEFKAALEINSREEMAHNNLGLIYVEREEFDKAEEEYEKEIEINPLYSDAYYNFGLLYAKQEEWDQAIEEWEKALNVNSNHNKALYSLAGAYYHKKELEKASQYAKELYSRGFSLPTELLNLLK